MLKHDHVDIGAEHGFLQPLGIRSAKTDAAGEASSAARALSLSRPDSYGIGRERASGDLRHSRPPAAEWPSQSAGRAAVIRLVFSSYRLEEPGRRSVRRFLG